jgi:molybdate transport system ATP-binding protein
MSVLKIENVSVKSQQQILLKNINLEVLNNQHWLVVGAAGAGKTVLLNTIAGKLRPVTGTLTLHDEPVETQRHLISLVTSKHHFKDITNTSNLYYQQRYNSSDSDQALTVLQYLQDRHISESESTQWTIENVTALLQLDELLHKEIIKLSNGETKRLRIASALLQQPQLLLLDDPLSGLDHATQERFNNILERIIAEGVTIIMSGSGHEIPSPITHVAAILNGTIIKTQPAQEYVPETGLQLAAIDKHELEQLVGDKSNADYEWIVKMTNVTVKYDKLTILNQINWQIRPADRWALFGHNGAGKSTLLSLINGDNPQAYANDITLFDKKRGTGESIWDIKSKIGFLSPELYQYFPADQSGLQVIESGYYDTQGLFRPSNATRAGKAMAWMKALHIDDYARKPLKSMPASIQRLCLLARALIKNPPLLILDEPCQGLDKLQRIHFNALIDSIAQATNLTLIYVTHYANELPTCIANVLKLEKGYVVDAHNEKTIS